MLTQIGSTFAGRVAASLLSAIGLPDLVVKSREEYQALAIELAFDGKKLENIRKRLNEKRADNAAI